MTRLAYGAVIAGLLIRIPGIFWGVNYPTGWRGHHGDEYTHEWATECLINPQLAKVCPAYSPGMAVHAALPLLAIEVFQRHPLSSLPSPESIILAGRIISVLYGAATIFVVFLLAALLFADPRVPALAAWLFALSGFHVAQSHFFLADAPVLFWLCLGLYLLGRELAAPRKFDSLSLAALCFGIAFGLKLSVVALASLGLVTLLYPPRLRRAFYAAIFFIAGLTIVTLASYSPRLMSETAKYASLGELSGVSRLAQAGLYLLEMPSLISLPMCILATAGAIYLIRKLAAVRDPDRLRTVVVVVILPVAISAYLVVFKLDHFSRHLLVFLPWIAMAAAAALVRLPRKAVSIPLFAYLALFVYDGERVFWNEPRNQAARWIQANVPTGSVISWYKSWWGRPVPYPGYVYSKYPSGPPPAVITGEMHLLNFILSGSSWRNSFPTDYRSVYGVESNEELTAWQALFKGTSPYRECARFAEGYFMPEYVLTEKLLGNRSRNYVSEVVMFCRAATVNPHNLGEVSLLAERPRAGGRLQTRLAVQPANHQPQVSSRVPYKVWLDRWPEPIFEPADSPQDGLHRSFAPTLS